MSICCVVVSGLGPVRGLLGWRWWGPCAPGCHAGFSSFDNQDQRRKWGCSGNVWHKKESWWLLCCVSLHGVPTPKVCRPHPWPSGKEGSWAGSKAQDPVGQWRFLVIKSGKGWHRKYRSLRSEGTAGKWNRELPRQCLMAEDWKAPGSLSSAVTAQGLTERQMTGLCLVLWQGLVLPGDESAFFSWVAQQMYGQLKREPSLIQAA